MKKLLSVILSITMLISVAMIAFADETVTIGAKEVDGIIKVGVNAEFTPFEYMENDKLVGFDIDLMKYIAARIGYGVEFVNMSFDKLIPAVVNGEVDCAISAITVTEERGKVVDFTRPYLEAKVTYNGEEDYEKYGILFPLNSINKARLIEASGDPFLSKFMLVDKAVGELTEDLTIDKLIGKYNLNKALDSDTAKYEYYKVKVENSEVIEEKDIPKYDSWEEAGLTAPAPDKWAVSDVKKAETLNITEKGKVYRYSMPISREEFFELVYNYVVNFSDIDINAQIPTYPISDTSNEKIRALYHWGIIKGKGAYTQEPVISPDGVVKRYFPTVYIAPNDLLTREEAATIVERLINIVHPELVSTELYYEFSDSLEISDWSMNAIQRLLNMGIMKGVGNNNFAPKDNYTTEQAIVTLVRVYANSGVSKIVIGGADAPTSITVTNDEVGAMEKHKEGTINYWLYRPQNPDGADLPLIVYLHGGSGKGDDLQAVISAESLPKFLYDGQIKNINAYVLCPQCPADTKGWSEIKERVFSLIDDVCKNYNIDESKIALTGHSMGGTGAWSLALARPERFSCVIPMSGTIKSTTENINKLSETKVWAFVGSEDKTVNPTASIEFIEALQKVNADARISVIDGAGHRDVPTLSYLDKTTDLINWIISQ